MWRGESSHFTAPRRRFCCEAESQRRAGGVGTCRQEPIHVALMHSVSHCIIAPQQGLQFDLLIVTCRLRSDRWSSSQKIIDACLERLLDIDGSIVGQDLSRFPLAD